MFPARFSTCLLDLPTIICFFARLLVVLVSTLQFATRSAQAIGGYVQTTATHTCNVTN